VYHIYDYTQLPVKLLATLAAGLREDSRSAMSVSGMRVSPKDLLMAAAVDRLSLLVWSKTKDAEKGRKRPKSIVEALTKEEKKEIMTFASAEEFEEARRKIINGN